MQATTSNNCPLESYLRARCLAIVEAWERVIPHRCVALLGEARLNAHLSELAEQLIDLLLDPGLGPEQARGVGARLAERPFVGEEVVGRTPVMLIEQLMQGAPAEQHDRLWARLSLLPEMTVGFLRRLQRPALGDARRHDAHPAHHRHRHDRRTDQDSGHVAVGSESGWNQQRPAMVNP